MSELPSKENKTPPGGVCHDLWGAEFLGSPCHNRVLKPPGGGSSDIFGTASTDEVNPHKRGTNQKNLQSSIILGGQTQKQNNDSDAATNGNSGKPVTPAIYVEPQIVLKTNIQENISSGTLHKAFNSESATASEDINYYNNHQRSSSKKKDGNPVTGEGYEALKPAAAPAQHVSAQSEPAPEQKKASRVPPGGYSSGLW